MSRTRNAVVGVIRHEGSNPSASAKCCVFHGFFFSGGILHPKGFVLSARPKMYSIFSRFVLKICPPVYFFCTIAFRFQHKTPDNRLFFQYLTFNHSSDKSHLSKNRNISTTHPNCLNHNKNNIIYF